MAKNLYFRTPLTRLGKSKKIEINLETKVFISGDRCRFYGVDYIEVSKSDFDVIINTLKENKFEEV